MQLTALRAQDNAGLHFCTFIIAVRPLSHTRSSKLLDLVCESGLQDDKSAKMQSRAILSSQCSMLHSNLLDLVCESGLK